MGPRRSGAGAPIESLARRAHRAALERRGGPRRCGGLMLDPWQRDAVTSDAPEQLWLAARQSGKSTCAAVRAVHLAASESGSLTLIGAAAMRQAGELFGKCKALLSPLGPRAPAIRRESLLSLTTV